MKTNLLTGGLSARRKTIELVWRSLTYASSRFVLIIMMGVIALTSCRDKEAKQAAGTRQDSTSQADTLPKPTTDISVNRRYDDKGNLIGFDSTYTSYYSNIPGDTTKINSLLKPFDPYFGKNHASWFNNRVNSLLDDPFFDDRYSIKRNRLNGPSRRGLIYRKDSINNWFYRDQSQKDRQSNDRI